MDYSPPSAYVQFVDDSASIWTWKLKGLLIENAPITEMMRGYLYFNSIKIGMTRKQLEALFQHTKAYGIGHTGGSIFCHDDFGISVYLDLKNRVVEKKNLE